MSPLMLRLRARRHWQTDNRKKITKFSSNTNTQLQILMSSGFCVESGAQSSKSRIIDRNVGTVCLAIVALLTSWGYSLGVCERPQPQTYV